MDARGASHDARNPTRGPWVATHGSPDDPAVTFTPKDGSGISVVWDWYCLETPEPDRTE
jgi:hypothetical protein